MKKVFYITETNKPEVYSAVAEAIRVADAGQVVEIKDETRTMMQNRLMWPYLAAFEKQLEWPVMVGGKWYQSKLSDWDWKDFLTGSFEGDMRRMAQGMEGNGLVMLGSHTSGFGKKKFSDFITFMQAFGAKQNVRFTDRQ